MKSLLSGLRGLLGSRPAGGIKPEDAPGTLINAYATTRARAAIPFPHVLHAHRDRRDPELAAHLRGFEGYVTAQGERTMTAKRYRVLRHIARVQQQFSLSVPDEQRDAFAAWAESVNAIAFLPDGSVRDPGGRVLVAPGDGAVDPASELPFPADARARKERTQAVLAGRALRVPTSLPPRESEAEIQPRFAVDIAGRAAALAVVSIRAESARDGAPIPAGELLRRLPSAGAHLTPTEREFLADDAPPPEAISRAGWHYESLLILEWMLGLVPGLPFPDAICDAGAVTRIVLDQSAKNPAEARLRTPGELLDALDLHYRLHWLAVDARLKQTPAPAGLLESVLEYRHHALNWLVRFMDADWDDVTTPT